MAVLRKAFALTLLMVIVPLTGCIGTDGEDPLAQQAIGGDILPGAPLSALPMGGPEDAVVIAVVDYGVNPYHLDWRATHLPQHLDDDPANDVPLDQAPDAYLPGFPDPTEAFASYEALELTLPENEGADAQDLIDDDEPEWDKVETSRAGDVHYYHVPGTKVIGLVDFAGNGAVATSSAHGAKASSVAAGNLFGSCPYCLLVFVNNGGEASLEWALEQPWIDAVTNSYGYSLVMRDRIYSGSDTDLSRDASERGQTIFFSAGNGQANTFTVPNPTLFSSQEGPDWMVTVGAVSPVDGSSYSGHGKPADIASVGSQYPSQGTPDTDSKGTFGGTSSATPTTAGTYARALFHARSALDGPSRVQENGTVAVGEPYACGALRTDCELADGELTAQELRTRLFHGAVHTQTGVSPSGVVALPAVTELEFMSEGHGTYFARLFGDGFWQVEFRRIADPLLGLAPALERPTGEAEWMVVDSWCRQHIWGPWTDGYYVDGETSLPGEEPAWPVRSGYQRSCENFEPPPAVVPADLAGVLDR